MKSSFGCFYEYIYPSLYDDLHKHSYELLHEHFSENSYENLYKHSYMNIYTWCFRFIDKMLELFTQAKKKPSSSDR